MMDTIRAALATPGTWVLLALHTVLILGLWRFGVWLTHILDRHLHPRLLRVLRVTWTVFMTYALLAVLTHLLRLDIEPLYTHGEALGTWFRASVGQMLTVVILAVLAWHLVSAATNRIVPSEEFNRRTVRIQTLKGVVESSLRISIIIIAGITILQNVGVNASTLLAGVSVLGLAVGFGAQSLIKDVFNGFFILLEDQYGVGDVITVNAGTLSGSVERLNLRVTVLRALDGTVHIIPNGQIQTVSVSSKDWSRVVALVTVAYQADVDAALRVMERVSNELYADPDYCEVFLEAPELHGVTRLAPDGVELRALFKVLPKAQWALGREFNRRIKLAMDAASIEIPFPQRTITFSGDPIEVHMKHPRDPETRATSADPQRPAPLKPGGSRDPEDDDEPQP
ncbi:mechanosensitive ion channel family protein [Deinococcus maricopensis]|uniref:MscS Mechanosensitive ion channel n=1 Tax=Deinococcus maricopensis (strain DSM 21211 / LMG 22137 / NRRL B-23946 / LB-34) TaxID=709986 RepID=E8UBU6_DEIML|nr:mechanosensitive ion channel family protein [Deinococcus maricopensis]ADV68535.1 MscS Mechanosensitive ion channel [Deinococcus maricopensis DSM 21211]